VTTDASHESASAQKILAWAFLLAFAVLTSVGRALLLVTDGDSWRFEILSGPGFACLLWVWIVSQGRPHRATFPLDLGFFLLGAWPVVVPACLWRFERWRGLGKFALVLGLYCFGLALTHPIFHFLRAFLELRGGR
jgi:hypothetical protein